MSDEQSAPDAQEAAKKTDVDESISREPIDARQRLLAPLDKLLSRCAEEREPAKKPVADYLNTPFVVTVLGGLLASLLTLIWQTNQKNHDTQLSNTAAANARRAEHYSKSEEFTETFADEFPAALGRLYSMVTPQCMAEDDYIASTQPGVSPELLQQLKKQNTEATSQFQKMKEKYLNAKNPETYCLRVAGIFESRAVENDAESLRQTLKDLFDIRASGDREKDKDRIDALNALANTEYEKLLSDMGTELKQARHKLEDL